MDVMKNVEATMKSITNGRNEGKSLYLWIGTLKAIILRKQTTSEVNENEANTFVTMCRKECARQFYQNAILFLPCDDLPQKRREIRQTIRDCICDMVSHLVPINDIQRVINKQFQDKQMISGGAERASILEMCKSTNNRLADIEMKMKTLQPIHENTINKFEHPQLIPNGVIQQGGTHMPQPAVIRVNTLRKNTENNNLQQDHKQFEPQTVQESKLQKRLKEKNKHLNNDTSTPNFHDIIHSYERRGISKHLSSSEDNGQNNHSLFLDRDTGPVVNHIELREVSAKAKDINNLDTEYAAI